MRLNFLLYKFLLCFGLVLSPNAYALSCAQFTPDMIVDSIKSNKNIVVVLGDLNMNGRFNLTRDQKLSDSQGLHNSLTANITGIDLQTDWAFDHEVQLNQYCVSVWCGGLQPVKNAIFLVHQDNDGYSIPLHACGGRTFTGFDDSHINDVKECFKSGECGSHIKDNNTEESE